MIVGGIDVGLTGALGLIDGDRVLSLHDFPTLQAAKRREPDEATLLAILGGWKSLGCELVVYESQQAFPGQGRSSAFSLGRTEGTVRTALAAVGLSREPAHPATWKRVMGLTGEKVDSRLVALRLFPGVHDLLGRRKDEGRAEALLLASYAARRMRAAA